MAYKVFSNGNTLNASELNTYLMNQSVIAFASAAARDAAIPAPLEGQLTWLEDSNKYTFYSGSAWADFAAPSVTNNAIINGGFDVWQRGTSQNIAASGFGADRWRYDVLTAVPVGTISQQTFTPGTAPVSGYEANFFQRINITNANGCTNFALVQRIEDVRSFANQTVTLSFWGKADASRTVLSQATQYFGSGGSSAVTTSIGSFNFETSWQRFTATITVPSIAGKTVTTNTWLGFDFTLPTSSGVIRTGSYDIWGVQVEAASSASAFKRSGSTLQEELANCQRYYWRTSTNNTYGDHGIGRSTSSTAATMMLRFPVTFRVVPTSVEYSAVGIFDGFTGLYAITALNLNTNHLTTDSCTLSATVSSGLSSGQVYFISNNNNSSGYIGLSAEL